SATGCRTIVNSLAKEFRGKEILVTGGAGCIGSNLVSTLLEGNPKRIVVLDDLSASREWNIPRDPKVLFLRGSVLDDKHLEKGFRGSPQVVFNLATQFAYKHFITNPDNDFGIT